MHSGPARLVADGDNARVTVDVALFAPNAIRANPVG
jgi:hypothetical protein